jgi:O-antigen/teichoic acid export membrane protein
MISLFSFKKEWGKVWQQQKNPKMMKELIQYGLPLIPTTSLTVVVMSADRLLLGWFLGTREAGLYATSYDLTASTMYLSLMAIYLASYPFITRALEQGGILQAHHQLTHYFQILLAVSVPASVGFAVLSANISHVMLGEEFWTASTEYIPWISIISLVTGLRMFYFDLSFHLSKNTSKLIWISFIVAAISIVFNFLFIPYYGCMSVVYVGLLATILGCIASWWMGRKIFLLPSFSPDIGKIILASFSMASILWPLRHLFGKEYLLLQIGVGVFSYGTIGLILNIANCRKKLISFRTDLLKIKSL